MSKRHPIKEEILTILVVGLISFLTFWVTIYRYQFKYKFLPALLAAKNAFLIIQQERVICLLMEEIKTLKESIQHWENTFDIQKTTPQKVDIITKCKRKQYKTTTLTLIYYTWTTLLGIHPIEAKKTSILLERLYGRDQSSLEKNFQHLVMARFTLQKGRPITEKENRFQEAIGFFEQIGYEPGVQFLIRLERKIGNRPESEV